MIMVCIFKRWSLSEYRSLHFELGMICLAMATKVVTTKRNEDQRGKLKTGNAVSSGFSYSKKNYKPYCSRGLNIEWAYRDSYSQFVNGIIQFWNAYFLTKGFSSIKIWHVWFICQSFCLISNHVTGLRREPNGGFPLCKAKL